MTGVIDEHVKIVESPRWPGPTCASCGKPRAARECGNPCPGRFGKECGSGVINLNDPPRWMPGDAVEYWELDADKRSDRIDFVVGVLERECGTMEVSNGNVGWERVTAWQVRLPSGVGHVVSIDKLRRFDGCGHCGVPDGCDHEKWCRTLPKEPPPAPRDPLTVARVLFAGGYDTAGIAPTEFQALGRAYIDACGEWDRLRGLLGDIGRATPTSAAVAKICNLKDEITEAKATAGRERELHGKLAQRFSEACEVLRRVQRLIGKPQTSGQEMDLLQLDRDLAEYAQTVGRMKRDAETKLAEATMSSERAAGYLKSIAELAGVAHGNSDAVLNAVRASVEELGKLKLTAGTRMTELVAQVSKHEAERREIQKALGWHPTEAGVDLVQAALRLKRDHDLAVEERDQMAAEMAREVDDDDGADEREHEPDPRLDNVGGTLLEAIAHAAADRIVDRLFGPSEEADR